MKLDGMSIQRPIGLGIQNVSLLEVINYRGRYIYWAHVNVAFSTKKQSCMRAWNINRS